MHAINLLLVDYGTRSKTPGLFMIALYPSIIRFPKFSFSTHFQQSKVFKSEDRMIFKDSRATTLKCAGALSRINRIAFYRKVRNDFDKNNS